VARNRSLLGMTGLYLCVIRHDHRRHKYGCRDLGKHPSLRLSLFSFYLVRGRAKQTTLFLFERILWWYHEGHLTPAGQLNPSNCSRERQDAPVVALVQLAEIYGADAGITGRTSIAPPK
jgi:hypothetical protein